MEPTEGVGRTWTIIFAVLALGFCASLCVYLVIYGKSENLLHQNALSWSFILAAGVLAGVGFGAIVNYLPALTGAKK